MVGFISMLAYNGMRQTIYIKLKYKKYNTIFTVHNQDSLILSPKCWQIEMKGGLVWKEAWGTAGNTRDHPS